MRHTAVEQAQAFADDRISRAGESAQLLLRQAGDEAAEGVDKQCLR